jgi:hypothetical protein
VRLVFRLRKGEWGIQLRTCLVWITVTGLIAIGIPIVAAILLRWDDPMDHSAPGEINCVSQRSPATGPLKLHDDDPCYFTDNNGKAIYLTGSHTWNNFQDRGDVLQQEFDYGAYMQLLQEKNHNFMRLWIWEHAAWAPWTKEKVEFIPLPYLRSGQGIALDGKPRYDLTQFNQAYFDRLRSRVEAAAHHGIYVSVMLFQGWSVGKKPNEPGNPWSGHPFHRDNNVSGIDGDLNGDGEGTEVHTLENPAVTAHQESYVRKVVDTVNDLDNVLWEICNEGDPGSMKWQNQMAAHIKSYELTKEKQHPVGITALYPGGNNDDLFRSAADWISPSNTGVDYQTNPPVSKGQKVIIADTDHVWGVGGDRGWVWKSFLRGLNPIYMDPFDDPRWSSSRPKFESCRRAMGQTLDYANRMNMATMTPQEELASTGYCLTNLSEDYLVYVPFDAWRIESVRFIRRLARPIRNLRWWFKQTVTVNLSSGSGTFLVEWFNPSTGETQKGTPVQGGRSYSFTAPFPGDAVLYIGRVPGAQGKDEREQGD